MNSLAFFADMATCDLHVLQCVDGCWQPVDGDPLTPPARRDPSRISFLTLNILFDFYYQELIYSTERYLLPTYDFFFKVVQALAVPTLIRIPPQLAPPLAH